MRRRTATVWAAVFTALLGFIAYGAFSGLFTTADAAVYRLCEGVMSPGITALFTAVTHLGGAAALAGGCAALLLIPRLRFRVGIPVAVVLAESAVFSVIIKEIFRRERPSILRLVVETGYSFPSAHTMNGMVFYCALAYFLRAGGSRFSRTAAVAAAVLVPLIGFSRIYLGVHYFSDVVGGLAGGAFALSAAYAAQFDYYAKLNLR